MRMPYVQAMAAPLACSLFAAIPGAKAAELQPPVPLYAVGLPTDATPGSASPPGSLAACPTVPPLTGAVSPGRLVVRSTPRPDVGPYTVTLLELADDATGQPESVTVLALDGLAAGTAVTQGSGIKVGVSLSRLLLMPASRAEVLVVNAGGAQAGR